MEKKIAVAIVILMTGLLMSPALAVESPQNDKQVAKQDAAASKVPQAQFEYQKKRQEFSKKRKEMLKLREQNANNSGGTTLDEINNGIRGGRL